MTHAEPTIEQRIVMLEAAQVVAECHADLVFMQEIRTALEALRKELQEATK